MMMATLFGYRSFKVDFATTLRQKLVWVLRNDLEKLSNRSSSKQKYVFLSCRRNFTSVSTSMNNSFTHISSDRQKKSLLCGVTDVVGDEGGVDATRFFWSSSGSNSNDPYDRYRVTDESNKSRIWREELEQENERTAQKYINTELYEQFHQEIMDNIEALPDPIPELGPTAKYLYGSKDISDEGKRLYFRQNISSGEVELVCEILFHQYELQAMSLSVDENFVAILLVDIINGGTSKVILREIDSGKQIDLPPPSAEHTTAQECINISTIEWGPKIIRSNNDNSVEEEEHSLYYVTTDTLGRPDTVWACVVNKQRQFEENAPISYVKKLLNESDGEVMVDVQRTKGCQYVAIQLMTKTSNEIYLSRSVDEPMILVRPREEGIMYHIDVGTNNDVFILASSAMTESTTTSCHWQLGLELSLFETNISNLPQHQSDDFGQKISCTTQDNHLITDMELFHGFVALYERSATDGRQRIRVKSRRKNNHDDGDDDVDQDDVIVPIPESVCAVSPGGNIYYNATNLYFSIESPTNPGTTYEYCTVSNKLRSLSAKVSQNGSNSDEQAGDELFIHKRLLVQGKDGTSIPLSLVYRKHEEDNNNNDLPFERPTILIGYGCYGQPLNLSYDPTLIPLLNRGFVIAYAHTRGGGDLGKAWYHAGRLYNKHNAINDYICCAQALCGEILNISRPDLLTAKAFSAGGVIVGAAVVRNPTLFDNVVLTNAFLDVKSTMGNNTLYLTEHEYEEFGDPNTDALAATSIDSYCPIFNMGNTTKLNRQNEERFPHFLLIGSLDDDQVPFWNATILAKKIQESIITNPHDVYLHIEKHGGHHLHGTRLAVAALENTFIAYNYCKEDL